MVDTATDMAMARGPRWPSLVTATADMAMDTDMATTARGLLMPSPAMATTAMAVMATDMARGLLWPSLATAMAGMAMDMDMATTARGQLMPSPAMATTAMAVMAMDMATTARGPLRLSPATAMAAMAIMVDDALLQRVQFFCDCLRIFNYVPR